MLVQLYWSPMAFRPSQTSIAHFTPEVSHQTAIYRPLRCFPSLFPNFRPRNRLSFMSNQGSSNGTWSTYQPDDIHSHTHSIGPSTCPSSSPTLFPPESPAAALAPEGDDSSISISISSTFFAGAGHDPTDVILLTTDTVYFYVHSSRLLQHSNNSFGGLLTDLSTPLRIAETSEVANLAFHALYGLDPSSYVPTPAVLLRAFSMLVSYGVDPSLVLVPNDPFYNVVVGLGAKHPLQTYSMAAKFSIEALAVELSKHLLTTPLHSVTEDIAQAMGATYLRRLVFLHIGRTERLKELMMQLPTVHEPSTDCSENDQKRLQREWRASALALSWSADPAMTPSQLHQAFLPLAQKKNLCPKCVEVRSLLIVLPSFYHS